MDLTGFPNNCSTITMSRAIKSMQDTITSIASHILARLMRPSNPNRNQAQSMANLERHAAGAAGWRLVAQGQPQVRVNPAAIR
jgi:hypothetical protein